MKPGDIDHVNTSDVELFYTNPAAETILRERRKTPYAFCWNEQCLNKFTNHLRSPRYDIRVTVHGWGEDDDGHENVTHGDSDYD